MAEGEWERALRRREEDPETALAMIEAAPERVDLDGPEQGVS